MANLDNKNGQYIDDFFEDYDDIELDYLIKEQEKDLYNKHLDMNDPSYWERNCQHNA